MAYTKPPPKPQGYSKQIRQMRGKTDIFLPGANPSSIKSLASRIGAEKGREYLTAAEDYGVRVWRLS